MTHRHRRSIPRRDIIHGGSSASTLVLSALLALAAVLLLFLSPDAAHGQQRGPKYSLPTLTHWCVGLDERAQLLPPGKIQLQVRPETDPQWHVHRYPDGLGGYSARGTSGMHTTDYRAALEDLGYSYDEVDVRDAYCVRDVGLLEGGQAVRISGDYSTPFSPNLWNKMRSTHDWRMFVQYNRAALYRNMGAFEAEQYIAVILQQIEDAERVCKIGAGYAADPSLGSWELNKAGACKPTRWFRPGEPNPAWARPVRIEFADPELGAGGFDPSRLSTGALKTDVIRR